MDLDSYRTIIDVCTKNALPPVIEHVNIYFRLICWGISYLKYCDDSPPPIHVWIRRILPRRLFGKRGMS